MHAELREPELGTLHLGSGPYIVTSIQVGSPEVREVVRTRALADGVFDDSRYLGARAITMSIRMTDGLRCGGANMQELVDQLTPYMSPRRRPTLVWHLRNGGLRSAVVRGVNWGWSIDGSRAANWITPQWVVPSGEILDGAIDARRCLLIKPSTDTEEGRTYDLTFPRTYPPSAPIGGRTVTNRGTAATHWTLTIYGPVEDPTFTINGVVFSADRLGGVTLAAGQTLVVSTRNRTVLFNGLANSSRYQNVNYDEWGWDELMLRPGDNTVRFDGDNLTVQSAAELCYTPAYL